ncbi:MAG: hypothetical protein EP343_16585 [Deltaproteobacteria bacterium]|nr:MAG: hypothetical protein EP343_16585 [Deltaproteobacteria bacterium]
MASQLLWKSARLIKQTYRLGPVESEEEHMRTNWMRIVCHVAVVFTVLIGWGCKKARPGVDTVDAGQPTPRLQTTRRVPARIIPQRALPQRRVAYLGHVPGRDDVQLVTQTLETVQSLYEQSFSGGKVRDWKSYLQAKDMLKRAAAMQRNLMKSLKRKNPNLASQLQRTVRHLQAVLAKKAHPQQVRLANYKFKFMSKQIDPKFTASLLSDYKLTLKKMHSDFVAFAQSGEYRVGLKVREIQPYYRWRQVRFSDRKSLVKPAKGSQLMLVAQLFDARTGAPLSGTEVSVEILAGKTKRQLLSKKMDQLWSNGSSKYIHNLKIPRTAPKQVVVQVSVSAFPVARTAAALQSLRTKATFQFPATWNGDSLTFLKPKKSTIKPVPQEVVGLDVMKAVTSVGGTIVETPIHRIGVALVPVETLWLWKNGSLQMQKPRSYFNAQVVAFVQDKKTGMLVPNARIQFFYEWQGKKGKFEFQKYLKPVFDGFPSYRRLIRLKPTTYNLRLRVDAPLSASFNRVRYPSYSARIKGFTPPVQVK